MGKKTVRKKKKKYVDIDEKIVNAIKILNEKGYTTRYCCSGHPENLDKIKKTKQIWEHMLHLIQILYL